MATQTPPEPAKMVGGLSRLKQDGGHTVAEVREFVAQMRGRSPQEVLGMISASELVRGVVLATIGTVVLLAVFTIGPYIIYGGKPTAKKAAEKPAPAQAEKPTETPATVAANDKPSDPDLDAAAKALKIDEVKTGEPDLDKLLDGEGKK